MPNNRFSEFSDKNSTEKEKGVRTKMKDRQGTKDGREGGEGIVKQREHHAKFDGVVVDPNIGNKNLPKRGGAEGGV